MGPVPSSTPKGLRLGTDPQEPEDSEGLRTPGVTRPQVLDTTLKGTPVTAVGDGRSWRSSDPVRHPEILETGRRRPRNSTSKTNSSLNTPDPETTLEVGEQVRSRRYDPFTRTPVQRHSNSDETGSLSLKDGDGEHRHTGVRSLSGRDSESKT